MKRIAEILLTATLAFTAAESMSAQDAPAPFRRISPTPTPSATPRPKATPTPTPTPTPKPPPSPSVPPTPAATPTPTAKPSASPFAETSPAPQPVATPARKEKPGRSILREKPVRAVEPRQPLIRRIPAEKIDGPPASRPTIDLSRSNWSTNSKLRSLENKWQAAIKGHDADALGKLLDEDFAGTSAAGKSASKARMLRELKSDKNVYRSVGARDLSIRMTRPGVAVVTGTAKETGTKEDGQKFISARRFKDTWKEHDGVWKCTSSEVKPLPKP